jgi:hypothetical protein
MSVLSGCDFGHLDDDGLAVGGVAHPEVAEQRGAGRHAEGGAAQAGAVRKRVLQSIRQVNQGEERLSVAACTCSYDRWRLSQSERSMQPGGTIGPDGNGQLHRVPAVFGSGQAYRTLPNPGQQSTA